MFEAKVTSLNVTTGNGSHISDTTGSFVLSGKVLSEHSTNTGEGH